MGRLAHEYGVVVSCATLTELSGDWRDPSPCVAGVMGFTSACDL